MRKHISLFILTFVVGAAISLAARAAMYKPVSGPSASPEAPAYAAMTDNTTAPAKTEPAPPPREEPAGHAGHENPAAAEPASGKAVNTICSVCGMDVDPGIPTATYQGKIIGFGCNACPAKFAANPDRYGPHALRNERAPK